MSDDARAWEDRDAIQQLIYRYSDAVTRADYEQMATAFATDAVWESPILGMHFESAREFIDFQIECSTALDVLIQPPPDPLLSCSVPTAQPRPRTSARSSGERRPSTVCGVLLVPT
jgi:hypothetical protein